LFTRTVPDFLIPGGRLPARGPVSGCELGRPLCVTGRSDAREDALARAVIRLAVDNNLIAVGVSPLPPRRQRSRFTALVETSGHVHGAGRRPGTAQTFVG
jgi:hypothetical protein